MIKRIIPIVALILAVAAILSSCELFGKDPESGSQGFSRIVYVDEELNLFEVRTGLGDLYGHIIPTVTDSEPAVDGEIVFGNSNRAITAKAKAELEKQVAADSKNDCGYIIYSDGTNVAIYWQHPDMAEIAVAKFVTVCIKEKRMNLDSGSLFSEKYVKAEFEKEKYWLALSAQAPADVVASLKKLYNYYNGPKILGWIANLYDPEIGAIYYSRSARDNEPFRPDIESTAQAISWLLNNKAIADRNVLPNDIKLKFIRFAQSMQSPVDGYFYHEQWAQDKSQLPVDRYGRDYGWATTTITEFRADSDGDGVDERFYPNWCAPNGDKCEEHTLNGGKCIFPQSASYYSDSFDGAVSTTLVASVSSAVSKLTSSVVTPTASVSSKPDYSSATAFSNWLEAYNESIKENSGGAHQLAAIRAEIAQRGYIEIVMDHLDRVQAEVYAEQIADGEEPTGLWQKNVDYSAVWGLLKYMSFYNASGYGRRIDIKYVPHIARTVVKVIALEPDGDYASNDLYNMWSGVSNLISNVRKYYGDSGVQQIYDIMRENCRSLIDNSLKKIEPFRKDDGSFSSRSDGTTGANIYGTHIALGVAEGNVNSTGLICSMYRCIYSALGYSTVPLCTYDDGREFIETISTVEPIEKEGGDAELDFENAKMPGSIKPSLKNEGATLTVESDPTGKNNLALCLVSTEGESSGDGLQFSTTGYGSECFVFEGRIYISTASDEGVILQMKMHENYMLLFSLSGDTVTIKDSATTTNNNLKANKICDVYADTWFKIRVEYYILYNENGTLATPQIKIFVDDEYVTTSDNFFGSHKDGAKPSTKYDQVNILSPRVKNSTYYFDDIFCSKESKIYDADSDDISDSRG